MKVVPPDTAFLVFNVDVRAGMEGQARALSSRFAARGARSLFVSTSFERRPLVERRGGVEVIRVPFARWWYWDTCLDVYETVAERVLRTRPVAAIVASPAITGAIACRIGARLRIPVVVRLACGGEFGDCAAIRAAPDPEREVRALAAAARVVCLSREIEDEARALGLPRERLVRLTNGVDLARFRRPRVATRDLLFLGRITAQKRVPLLLRAFARLAPGRRHARLLIAGQGDATSACRALARDLGLDGQVSFLGVRDDVPALLSSARALVLPSAGEGNSNALLEALAAGTPVVASTTPGNLELLGEGDGGVFFPVDDEEALAAALERILDDDGLATELSDRARARARAFDLESSASTWADLVADVSRERPHLSDEAAPSLLALATRGLGRAARNAARKVGLSP